MEEQDEILNDFLVECSEGIGKLDQDFVVLEKEPANSNLLASIFRTIHTIKGTCGFLGLPKLENVAHGAENVLARMRDGKMTVTPESISILLEAIDGIKEIMAHLEEKRTEPEKNYTPIREKLDGLLAAQSRQDSPVQAAAPAVSLPSPAGPPLAEPVNKAEGMPSPAPSPDGPSKEEVQGSASEKGQSAADSTIRVHTGILDQLMNLVGELVLARNQLVQRVRERDDTVYASSAQRLNLVTAELQDAVMKTRMQPIKTVWDKFPRIVRDLAKSQGKEVELVMEGAQTELDRTLLEAIKDPLTHIVRNTVDHGIESSDIRKERGKPAKGTLFLKAYHGSGQIVVEIKDDGGGINIEKVKRKALEKGLISRERAESLPEREILDLIFLPGLSTAEKITNVSGRGVGMDVVKTNIEKIGGTLEISSQAGKGMTLMITIPLTLAIIPALMVTSGGEMFAIPQASLLELVMVDENAGDRIETIQGAEFFRLRGTLLSLVRLDKLFDLKRKGIPSGKESHIVVLGNRESRFGLVVDEVNDSQEIVVKPLNRIIKKLPVFAGATILGNGRISLILDPAGIAAAWRRDSQISPQSERGESPDSPGRPEGAERQSLLIFTLTGRDRFAVPLSIVTRLEEIEQGMVEKVAAGEVVQYRNNLLYLIRIDRELGLSPPVPAGDKLPVIVFTEKSRSVGLVVREILNIIEGDIAIFPGASNVAGIIGSAIIEGKTTELIDLYTVIDKLHPEWFRDQVMANGHSGLKVLHVDDSPFFRKMIRPHLEMCGYTVYEASDGVEALAILEDTEVDLVVSDIEMPQMNGFELAVRVSENPKFKGVPMVALSSLNSEADLTRGREAGFAEFIIKYDRESFLNAIQRVLSGKGVHV